MVGALEKGAAAARDAGETAQLGAASAAASAAALASFAGMSGAGAANAPVSSPAQAQAPGQAPGQALGQTTVQPQVQPAAAPVNWPMPVDVFLAGNFLERGDVVLTRRKGDIFSKLIRWVTRSHFSHAAMVFIAPHRDPEYNNTFVIEAGTSGVDLADIKHYATDKNSVIAIRRLKRDWFDPPKHTLVRGRMLNNIRAGYSYSRALAVLRRLWFRSRRVMQSQDAVLKSYKKQGRQPPNEYICSGLIQVGYAYAIAELIRTRQAPRTALKQVLFGQDFIDSVPDDWSVFTDAEADLMLENYLDILEDDLEGITPQELAVTPNLAWLYVMRDNKVYRVDSYQEASKLLYWRPKQSKASATLPLAPGQEHFPV